MSSSTPSTDMENGVEENTFKILLATDCHLGYEDSTSKSKLLLYFIDLLSCISDC